MRAAWLKSAGASFSSGMVSDRRSAGSCTDKFITAFFYWSFYPSFCSTDGLRTENNLISKMGNCLELESSRVFLSISTTTCCFTLNFSGFNDYLITVLIQTDV